MAGAVNQGGFDDIEGSFVRGRGSETPSVCKHCGAVVGEPSTSGENFRRLHLEWHARVEPA